MKKLIFGISGLFLLMIIVGLVFVALKFNSTESTFVPVTAQTCNSWFDIGKSCQTKQDCFNYLQQQAGDVSGLADDEYRCNINKCEGVIKC